jgi:hypothetical protein
LPREIDPNSPKARRFQVLLARIVNDLGGEDMISTAQMQLAQRCAKVSLECEILERSESFDLTAYTTMMGHLSRTLKMLGPQAPAARCDANVAVLPRGAATAGRYRGRHGAIADNTDIAFHVTKGVVESINTRAVRLSASPTDFKFNA